MAGRRPKPTRLKILTGNPGKRALPESEPIPPDGAIVRPLFLKYRECELWDEWEPILTEMGTLTVADVPPFARWCVKMAQFEEEKRSMNAAELAQMRMLEADLGIGAAARAKLGTNGKKKPQDPAEAYFGAG